MTLIATIDTKIDQIKPSRRKIFTKQFSSKNLFDQTHVMGSSQNNLFAKSYLNRNK